MAPRTDTHAQDVSLSFFPVHSVDVLSVDCFLIIHRVERD